LTGEHLTQARTTAMLEEETNMVKRISYRTYKNVLTAIKNGESRPTRISHQSNVSYSSLMNCLSHLENVGCVEKRQQNGYSRKVMRKYSITKKGNTLLLSLQKAEKIIDK
jgi:predicted transcriptional regulator